MRPPCAQAPLKAGAGIASTHFRQLFAATAALTDAGRCLLYDFSMQREVETVALRAFRHPQADEHLDHGEDDQADDGIINEDNGNPDALIEELTNISFQNARRSAICSTANTPVSSAPTIPPTACTPKQSSASS